MHLEQIQELDKKYYMNTFGSRIPISFAEGKGITLKDTEGREFKDFFAGIAVNCLGYGHPRLVAELQDQIAKLTHISNVFYNENQTRLAQVLVENSCLDKVFFANTGAEANEGAIKLVRKYFSAKDENDRFEIITLQNSFHGRTLATIAATGQEKYQKPFRPMVDKFVHVEVNNIERLKAAVNSKTAAIMIELIQGESGVLPLDREYVNAIVEICKENDILLVVDEVQTGIGRTGKLFAYEWYNIEPDIVTLAKGLGGGITIGAVLAKEKVSAFEPGDHGTTFGGNPLSARAGLVVMDELLENGLLKEAAEKGEYFISELVALSKKTDKIDLVRGKGLMIGVVFKDDIAKDIGAALRDNGYIVGVVGTKVLRLVPPLVLTKEDIDGFVKTLGDILKS